MHPIQLDIKVLRSTCESHAEALRRSKAASKAKDEAKGRFHDEADLFHWANEQQARHRQELHQAIRQLLRKKRRAVIDRML